MIEPRRATLPVNFPLPWEFVQLVVTYEKQIRGFLDYICAAADARESAVQVDDAAREETARQCDKQIDEWRALAHWALVEVERRSNRKDQRPAVMRQLAAERGMKLADLARIIRVHGDPSAVRRSR